MALFFYHPEYNPAPTLARLLPLSSVHQIKADTNIRVELTMGSSELGYSEIAVAYH